MNMPITVRTKLHFERGRRREKVAQAGDGPQPLTAGRIPRIARLLALAHRFEQLIRDGFVKDYADLARLGHVTRARLSQIMNLLQLAPEIQEEILFLPPVLSGSEPICERRLRQLIVEASWRSQCKLWRQILHT